jgi:hypothetical protein
MVWRKKSDSESSSSSPGASPRYDDEREKVPKGHVPMVTGCGERVVVPVRLLSGSPATRDISGGSSAARCREPARRPATSLSRTCGGGANRFYSYI